MSKSHITFILFFITIIPLGAKGATFFFDPTSTTILKGEEFSVELKMDTDGEFLNAIGGKIEFPSNMVRVKNIETTEGIIHLWIEEPEVHGNEIIFSGIIPGGFDGVRKPLEQGKFPGNLFKITFEAKRAGDVAVILKEIQALKNDNAGSEVESTTIPLSIDILSSDKNSPLRVLLPSIIIVILIGVCFKIIKLFF